MFNIYDNIKDLAVKHGYTVSGMCDAMGMSRATLSNLKNGRAETLSIRNFKRIAEFLGEPLDVVMHGAKSVEDLYIETSNAVLEGIKKDPTSISADEVLAEELINRLCLLTDEELAKVDAFVQGLLASR